jgi:hypothetical protein
VVAFDPSTHASGLPTRSSGLSWDAELVGQAIVQAFVTLDLLPKVQTPRGPGSNWPKTMVEWSDQLAQAELETSERRDRQQDANRTKILPSSLQISQMEIAFDWLRELRLEDTGMALIVTFWALRTSQGRSIRRLCIEKHWAPRTFWRKRSKALDSLALRLNARYSRVF